MLAHPTRDRHIRTAMPDQPDSPVHRPRAPIRSTIEGNRLEVIESGQERMAALLDLIGGARTSVRLLFYIFKMDGSGERVRDALAEAVARGVKVQILLDGFGSGGVPPSFFSNLAEAGGSLCLFHPSYGRRYLVRNHQKLAIADDRLAIIGGANIQDEYLTDEGERHWRDLWLSVEGPAVERAVAYFDALFRWTTTKGAKLRALRRIIARFSEKEGALQWKFSGPLSIRNPWPSSLGRDLQDARRLDVISAYFSPPRSMLRRIARLGRRGVVRIITAAKSDNNATIAAARYNYGRVLRHGVRMFEYQAARLHSKLMIVDDVVHIGSANFDFRSVYINLEIMLRIEDAGFAAAMRGYFERELADSEEITRELHRQRSTLWRRLKWTLSHWLVTTMDYTVTRRLNFRQER
jgi:cardiolipin synthase